MRVGSLSATALVVAVVAACDRTPAPAPDPSPEPAAASGNAADTATPPGPLVLARGVRFVRAPAGPDVRAVVREERARAARDGRELVVYVGATWCEPCKHFHEAANRGDLDPAFPALTVLEFDLDEDRDRLASAGYVSQFIPLFVVPTPEGGASERRFEGAVKGDRAVATITPKLRAILDR